MEDGRKPFRDAISSFRDFACAEGKPSEFLWIVSQRVHVFAGRIWIFRPEDLIGDAAAELFYESARTRHCSIKFLGIDTFENRYVTAVEEMSAPPHDPNQLYFSLHSNPQFRISSISNSIIWAVLRRFRSRSSRDIFFRKALSLDRGIKETWFQE